MSAPWTRRRTLAVGATLAVLAFVAAAAASFVLRPFWWFERIGKSALRSAGLARTSVDGPRGPIVYWRGGSGPTLVLLHGANDQAGAWAKVAAPLAKTARLVVPDLPGHGESAPAAGPLAVADLVAGLGAVLAVEGPEPVTLVGNSLGGFVSALYAEKNPGRVRQVVLVNGALVKATPARPVNLLPRSREEARATMDALTDPGSPRVPAFVLDDVVRRSPGSPMERMMQQPMDLALEARLSAFPVPVTFLWGEADQLLPRSDAVAVAARLPAARLEGLPQCGHVPQRECPDRLLAALEKALREPPRPKRP